LWRKALVRVQPGGNKRLLSFTVLSLFTGIV
jgi:hypothetical protein